MKKKTELELADEEVEAFEESLEKTWNDLCFARKKRDALILIEESRKEKKGK